MSALPESKVPGSRVSRNRATRQAKATSSFQSTPAKPTAPRRYRHPFPALSLRRYHRWPEGLAYLVGMNWSGRQAAA